MPAQWCKGSEPRALFVFVGPHSVIRLRNALRPSSFPPPYPPPPDDLPLRHPPARPSVPVTLPFSNSPFRPHVPSSSSGGSNGCGGICQAVTHPHGRILGYVFARSLPPRFIPITVYLPFFLFLRFRHRTVTSLAVCTCIRLSICWFIRVLRQPSVHFFL